MRFWITVSKEAGKTCLTGFHCLLTHYYIKDLYNALISSTEVSLGLPGRHASA